MTETKLTSFPCPICGKFFKPYLSRKDGKAMMECPKDGLFETSIKASKNFRKFCSKLGKKPNRSPNYYTAGERKIKEWLELNNMKEGLEFFHNSRVKLRGRWYWLDFVVPESRTVIEYSPEVWHKLWNRKSADERKKEALEELGYNLLSLNDKDLGILEVAIGFQAVEKLQTFLSKDLKSSTDGKCPIGSNL